MVNLFDVFIMVVVGCLQFVKSCLVIVDFKVGDYIVFVVVYIVKQFLVIYGGSVFRWLDVLNFMWWIINFDLINSMYIQFIVYVKVDSIIVLVIE